MTTEHTTSIKWIATAVTFLVVGAGGGYWWAHHAMSSGASMAASSAPAAPSNAGGGPASKRRILYWHDPMVPGQKFDKPGKSPFMDMQLVPVYADEADEGGDVRINPAVAQNLGIRLGRVERTAVNNRLRAVGSVAFDERLLELVQARVEGYIKELYVKAPLERVKRGQPLAEILAPQWLEAEQEYVALLDAGAERAQTLRDAARLRLVVLGVPETTIRNAESTRKTNATTTILAPLDGVVAGEQGSQALAGHVPDA
jgi:Cu(I)/Ag(I) efflux system membrane fusion protein